MVRGVDAGPTVRPPNTAWATVLGLTNVSVTFTLLTFRASASAEKISRVIFHRRSTWLRMLTRRYRSRQLVKVGLNLPEHRQHLKDGPCPRSAKKTCRYRQWRTEGGGRGLGVQPPPPEIPKAFQNRAKLNPIVKTVKNCWI